MITIARKLAMGTAVGAAVLGLTAPTAGASTASTTSNTPAGGSTLAAIKAKAAAAISIRETALQVAVTDVGANPYLTSSDRTTILSVLTSDESDLTALGATIQADTTAAQAESDYRTIFTTYRVFALRLPQARFAEASDDLTGTVLPRLTDAQSRLEALLSGPDSGKNTAQVQQEMQDLANQIGTISADTNGLAATVLAITPAQWNSDPTILSGPRSKLVSARAAAHTADRDVAAVVKALQ